MVLRNKVNLLQNYLDSTLISDVSDTYK